MQHSFSVQERSILGFSFRMHTMKTLNVRCKSPFSSVDSVPETATLFIDEGKVWSEGQSVSGVRYKDFEGVFRDCKAHITIVCDGMYSTLRKQLTEPDIRYPSFFVGLKVRNCKLPYPNCGHVVLGKPSPILVYPISSDVARVLVDVPGDKLPSKKEGGLPHYLKTTIAPQIPEALREAFLEVKYLSFKQFLSI